MNRRDLLKAFVGGAASVGFVNLTGTTLLADDAKNSNEPININANEGKGMKYDNDFFYKDGVFQQDKAFQAYYEMFEEMNYSIADSLRSNPNFWVADFGLGDFAHVGMG